MKKSQRPITRPPQEQFLDLKIGTGEPHPQIEQKAVPQAFHSLSLPLRAQNENDHLG